MEIKLFDSELKVMDVLWREGDQPAKYVAKTLTDELGWNVNTTYTLIKRCIKKGAIERTEPNFMCHALIPKKDVQEAETNELINKIYDGSADKLFAALLSRKKLSAEHADAARDLVAQLIADGKSGQELVEGMTVEAIGEHLYTSGQPDPDLVIRTSGEQRLSGFLLWQSAYSEIWFTEAYWPAFRRIDFLRAMRDYGARNRRFGK